MRKTLVVLSVVMLMVSLSFAATKITVWGMGEEANSLDKLAQLFMEEYPEYEVDVQAIPGQMPTRKF